MPLGPTLLRWSLFFTLTVAFLAETVHNAADIAFVTTGCEALYIPRVRVRSDRANIDGPHTKCAWRILMPSLKMPSLNPP